MKVSQLSQLLRTANPDAEVFLSSDEEGNAHYPVLTVEVQGTDKQLIFVPKGIIHDFDDQDILKPLNPPKR